MTTPGPPITPSWWWHHPWRSGDTVRGATGAIYHARRGGTWIPGQQRRMRQLAPPPGTRPSPACSAASPGWQDDGHSHPVVEIAIYPDVVWLAARSLQVRSANLHAAR